jgi:hypothetical protein
MHIASIGIDLGKTTFHLVALGERNKVLIRKKFSRAQLLANLLTGTGLLMEGDYTSLPFSFGKTGR